MIISHRYIYIHSLLLSKIPPTSNQDINVEVYVEAKFTVSRKLGMRRPPRKHLAS